jgi:hypothetical protein
MIKGSRGTDGPLLPLLGVTERAVLRADALRLADGPSPVAQSLRHELAPGEPAAQEAARQAGDRILSRSEPISGQVAIGSGIVTDSYLAGLLPEQERVGCLEKLLAIAEDSREAASNRQVALSAAANLVLDNGPGVKASVFARSKDFVIKARDGSAFDDEMTGTPHPLSFLRISMGEATLRGHGLHLAGASAADDSDRRWVRDQAVELLRSADDGLVQRAALVLARMATVTVELDADLLATHRHPNVRQLSAHLCVRQPVRHRATALGLAKDSNPRVRRVLAEAAARAYAENPEALDELIEALASDVRYSVRAAASSAHKV